MIRSLPFDDHDTASLIAGAQALGVELELSEATTLLTFLDLFYAWNDYAGFTSIPRRDAVRLHLLDSLAVAPELEITRDVVDLGSGGGMPGMPGLR